MGFFTSLATEGNGVATLLATDVIEKLLHLLLAETKDPFVDPQRKFGAAGHQQKWEDGLVATYKNRRLLYRPPTEMVGIFTGH